MHDAQAQPFATRAIEELKETSRITRGDHSSASRSDVLHFPFEKLIGHLRDEGSPGRPGYPVLVLFRALLLQSLYGLSERELEEALGDRLSFKRFVGLSLEDATPDHTVLNRFRNQLVEEGLLEKLWCPFFGEQCAKVGRSKHARHVGIPNAVVGDMILHERRRILRVGTHNRGAWEVDI